MARILVIDDDPGVRDILNQMLVRLGHDCETAPDGKEGMRIFRNNPAELVITDILMPEKEGIETILELRREFPDVKIVAISGGGAVGPEIYLTMAKELGADRTLSKPFNLRELSDLLSDLL